MADFGWSLPPGCGRLPGEDEPSIRGLVYLTSTTARAEDLTRCAGDLEAIGFEMATDWFRHVADRVRDEDVDSMLAALIEWDALDGTDVFVCFTEEADGVLGKGGRHALFGSAYRLCKRTIVVGPREHLFHFLPDVEVYATWAEALAAIGKSDDPRESPFDGDDGPISGDEYDPFGGDA